MSRLHDRSNAQLLARIRKLRKRVVAAQIAATQFQGIHAKCVGKFVHGLLQAEDVFSRGRATKRNRGLRIRQYPTQFRSYRIGLMQAQAIRSTRGVAGKEVAGTRLTRDQPVD